MIDRSPERLRIVDCNQAPIRPDGEFVLYWMIAFRRVQWNFSLDRAIAWALELRRPLVIFEPLRIRYRWASDRIHRFVIDGMADNAKRIARHRNPGVLYYPYVEPAPDEDKGLLEALAERACVVVTDDFPAFFLPRMVASAANRIAVKLEKVDSNGLLPLRATTQVFTTAFSFRKYLQKQLPSHLSSTPKSDPLARITLPAIDDRCPPRSHDGGRRRRVHLLDGAASALAQLPIDHSVSIVKDRGGPAAACTRLDALPRSLARKLHHARESSG